MSFVEVKKAVEAQLDRNSRGDYGWWLVTRVHLTPGRLRAVVDYIFDIGGDGPVEMTPGIYRSLGDILGIENDNPAQTINRHIFLAMQTPLRLIERTDGARWSSIRLTGNGLRLHAGSDPSVVFESVLREIRFCKEPWFTAERVESRKDFDVNPYVVTLDVLRACGGRIDVDEFDLFVSRIRTMEEVGWAIANVLAFRPLSPDDKAALLREVETRTPGTGKPYANWRDMARHTFSLFSMGSSALRDRNELFLADGIVVEAEPVRKATKSSTSASMGTKAGAGPAAAETTPPRAMKPRPALKLPHVEAPPDLLIPPVHKALNSGDDAEILIGKMFAASGWAVVYYGQRRGYGFDIWVRKGDAAFVIEVKSGTGPVSSISLTQTEHEAAIAYGKNFLIAVVEHIGGSSQAIHIVDDPVTSVGFNRIEDHKYRSSGDWRAASKRYDDVA